MNRPSRIRELVGFGIGFVLLAWFNTVVASGLGVTPIRVYLSEGTPQGEFVLPDFWREANNLASTGGQGRDSPV